MKRLYVQAVRAIRPAADRLGLLEKLESSRTRKRLWLRSLFGIYDSQDLIRLDLPWWTFDAIDEVDRRISLFQGSVRVFEYGAGASTVWLAKRGAEIVSVEHDADFASGLQGELTRYPLATLLTVRAAPSRGLDGEIRSQRKGHLHDDFTAYVRSIDDVPGQFDLIVIDGRARAACLATAKNRLTPNGFVVFDNSNRREYQDAILASGLTALRLPGMAPALPFPSETALLLQGRTE